MLARTESLVLSSTELPRKQQPVSFSIAYVHFIFILTCTVNTHSPCFVVDFVPRTTASRRPTERLHGSDRRSRDAAHARRSWSASGCDHAACIVHECAEYLPRYAAVWLLVCLCFICVAPSMFFVSCLTPVADPSNMPVLPEVPNASRVLVILNAVDAAELTNEETYHEIVDDIRTEFEKYGRVQQVRSLSLFLFLCLCSVSLASYVRVVFCISFCVVLMSV